MPNPDLKGDDRAARRGYMAAIAASALGHAALFGLVLVVLPRFLRSGTAIPPAYTVKIVDQLPAGQLGTHLPPIAASRRNVRAEHHARHEEAEPRPVTPITGPAPGNDKNVIALNTRHQSTPTPTPTPTRTPTPVATATPRPKTEPTSIPSPSPSAAHLRRKRLRAKPVPTPKRVERRPKPTPAVQLARAEHEPSVKEQLAKLREQLLAEHLAAESKKARKEGTSANAQPAAGATAGGAGLLVGKAEIGGPGAGIGPGSGSMGIQQDLDFLLYYRQVQEKIKKAWSFSGGYSDLNTTVIFAIGPDGTLTGVKITRSSHDPAFDDSVVRAIRRAAPFSAPPEKYRSQFAEGIEAVFKLGELSSTS